jgi:transcriptional regulator with XRE-family HTH domain
LTLDYYVIGSRIRQYRQELGITQEDLALQINTSTAYISNIERGLKKPSLQKLVEIADAMHVTVNDFIYVCPYTSYPSYDRELEYLLSTYTLEKQRRITKSIAEIIKTLSE